MKQFNNYKLYGVHEERFMMGMCQSNVFELTMDIVITRDELIAITGYLAYDDDIIRNVYETGSPMVNYVLASPRGYLIDLMAIPYDIDTGKVSFEHGEEICDDVPYDPHD
jgi:hypothetical protein